MKISGQLQAPSALAPGKELLVPLDRRMDGPWSRSGSGGDEKNTNEIGYPV
jgi:hypothetical protein